jgi:hypothetical protein
MCQVCSSRSFRGTVAKRRRARNDEGEGLPQHALSVRVADRRRRPPWMKPAMTATADLLHVRRNLTRLGSPNAEGPGLDHFPLSHNVALFFPCPISMSQLAAPSFHLVRRRFGAARAIFTRRRTASGRDKSSSCFDIHTSSACNSSGGKRVLTGVASTRGRPRNDFLALDIDLTIF